MTRSSVRVRLGPLAMIAVAAVSCSSRHVATNTTTPKVTTTIHSCAVEPPGPLVSLDEAQRGVAFAIQTPSALPAGVALQGVLVDADGATVRVHFSDGVVLFEYPSQDARPAARGLEFDTTVGGYPALGIESASPPPQCGPGSQLKWWTGQMFFDLYGPVSFDDVRLMAESVQP